MLTKIQIQACAPLLLTTLLLFSTVKSEEKIDCSAGGSTQMEMNICAGRLLQSADLELNSVYSAVLKQHASDESFVKKLKIAQRAWVAWRDAELDALYPNENPPTEYGSVFPMCRNSKLEQLTRERTKQLKQWLDGTKEGDVCAGSIPIK